MSPETIPTIDDALRARIAEAVEALAPEMIEAIRAVVQIPSVCGDEAAMQAHMVELYRREGLAVETLAPDIEALRSHPGFVDTQMSYADRANVVARLQGAGRGRSLILNGHMDVVSPGDTAQWSRDPWGGEIDGDWMYGRGAGDMKAGLIANL
jgi:acetylornithine deacetylase